MKATWTQTNFNSGEWSPLCYGRFDLAQYKNALSVCQNYIPQQQGGLTRRPGTIFTATVKDSAKPPMLRRFEFSASQSYILEFGDLYLRIYTHDSVTGLPGRLENPPGTPVEVVTPYYVSEVWGLGFVQSGDTLYITHANYTPRKLQRAGTYNWTMSPVNFLDGPYLPVNLTATTLTPDTFGSSGGTATVFSSVVTLVSAPTLGAVAIGQIMTVGAYNGTILSLASGVLNQAGSSYNMSASGTILAATACTTSRSLAAGGNIPVTASSTTGINGGTGFRVDDVGRMLRIKCGGVWVWGTVNGFTDTTHITWQTSSTTGSQLPTTAQALANVSGGSVFGVSVTDGGSGYGVQPPSVSFSGGGGSGAVAFASLTNGVVTGITMSVSGSGYSSAPTVTLSAPTAIVPGTTTFWRLGLWDNTTGNGTTCVTYHQDRLVFGGAAQYPGRVDASASGDYENFAPTNLDGTVVDNSALSFTINSNTANRIVWMTPDENGLLIGTGGAEWVVSPGNSQTAITPTNVSARQMSNYGSAGVNPVRVGKATLFVQRTGRKLRELFYQFTYNTFQATDLSLLGEHLTASGLKQMAVQFAPQQIVWLARNDGTLLGLTYDRDQQTLGWHSHPLGGYSDAAQSLPPQVVSVACIPAYGNLRDEVWMVVQRWVNGAPACSVEVMAKLWESGDNTADATFLDCSASHTYGSPGTSVTGLTWLKGQTVGVLTDGAVHPDCVVDSTGAISLQWPATTVRVGLKYMSKAQTLGVEAGGGDGPSQGKIKRIHRLVVRFFQSIGLTVGSSDMGVTAYPQSFRTSADPMTGPVGLFSGDKRWSYEGTWGTAGMCNFQTDDPLPSNITMLMVQLDTEDGQ